MSEPIQTENLEAKAAEAMGTETPNETPIEKIKLGETEYDPSELQSLVELGKIGKEAEEKWNTKIDSLFPAYSKSQNEKKELEEKLKAFEVPNKAESVINDPNSTPDETAEAKRVLKEQFGLVDKDEVKNIFNELLNTDKSTTKLLGRTSELEGQINGEDGRPAFKTEDVLNFMAAEGIKDPEKAYKLKYEKELDTWKESQIGKAKTNGLVTESSSTAGGKVPSTVKIDSTNLIDILKENL